MLGRHDDGLGVSCAVYDAMRDDLEIISVDIEAVEDLADQRAWELPQRTSATMSWWVSPLTLRVLSPTLSSALSVPTELAFIDCTDRRLGVSKSVPFTDDEPQLSASRYGIEAEMTVRTAQRVGSQRPRARRREGAGDTQHDQAGRDTTGAT